MQTRRSLLDSVAVGAIIHDIAYFALPILNQALIALLSTATVCVDLFFQRCVDMFCHKYKNSKDWKTMTSRQCTVLGAVASNAI